MAESGELEREDRRPCVAKDHAKGVNQPFQERNPCSTHSGLGIFHTLDMQPI